MHPHKAADRAFRSERMQAEAIGPLVEAAAYWPRAECPRDAPLPHPARTARIANAAIARIPYSTIAPPLGSEPFPALLPRAHYA